MKLHTTLQQTQVLSSKMIQSAEILQMSVQELDVYIREISLENPVIELEKEYLNSDTYALTLQKYKWLKNLDIRNSYVYSVTDREDDSGDHEDFSYAQEEQTSLKKQLWSQLLTRCLSETETSRLQYLLEMIDGNGYLMECQSELAKDMHIEEATVSKLVKLLQSLEPAGVGAQTLSECLLLQLERMDLLTDDMRTLIEQHLALIAKNMLPQISRKMKLPLNDIKKYCDIIKNLNPKPGSIYSPSEKTSYITADVFVVRFKDSFQLLLNEYLYPNIEINPYYLNLSAAEQTEEVSLYLVDKIRQVEWLMECISKRNETLLRTSQAILKQQECFFLKGPGHLKPFRLAEAAEQNGVHESTISRTIKNKYVQCMWGTFPMSYFFPRGEVNSVTVIKHKLKKLITDEPKEKPYSDRQLMEYLQADGITLSRRTVAKYRKDLNIGDASSRKTY